MQDLVPGHHFSSIILLNVKEVSNTTTVSIVVCPILRVGGLASHTIGKVTLSETNGMEWRKFLVLVKLVDMLLDLDEGTLSVYKNGRKLGVMKRGLAGHYCWVVALVAAGSQVSIKRGPVPES